MKENATEMITECQSHLAEIVICRNIRKDEIVRQYSRLLHLWKDPHSADPELLEDCFHQIFSMLIERYAAKEEIVGDLWKNHIIHLLLRDENVFSLSCEKGQYRDLPEGLLKIVKTDLEHIHSLFRLDGSVLRKMLQTKALIGNLPSWEIRPFRKAPSINASGSMPTNAPGRISSNASGCIFDDISCSAGNDSDRTFDIASGRTGNTSDGTNNDSAFSDIFDILYASGDWSEEIEPLAGYYSQSGCGIFNQYRAFRWNRSNSPGCLTGVESPDPIRLFQLIGYENERSIVIKNTLQFLQGLPCNNILLYGDRGTGKSAAVKAILNEYADRKLRLIEVSKYHLSDLPYIMETLRNRGMKFILFIDDLSFESDETSYRELKSILEGGIEARPQNIVIYATSNRRHLIKEYFSERSTADEVGSQDTLQEKLSLSDRFGITVTFSLPDKEGYLQIVEGLAKQRGLAIDTQELREKAWKWEMRYNGRSPRTARQFIDHLEGEQQLKNTGSNPL